MKSIIGSLIPSAEYLIYEESMRYIFCRVIAFFLAGCGVSVIDDCRTLPSLSKSESKSSLFLCSCFVSLIGYNSLLNVGFMTSFDLAALSGLSGA